MRRIDELESLRGVMALWVVVGHVFKLIDTPGRGFPLIELAKRNNLPVDVFIILSGFVIFYLLDRRREDYVPFLARRFMRLFPVYLPCLALAIWLAPANLAALRAIPWQTDNVVRNTQFIAESLRFFWPNVLSHLVLLHGLIPPHIVPYGEFAFLTPAWSVSLEWQFYLVAPLVYAAILSRMRAAILLLLVAVLLLDYISGPRFGEAFLGRQIPFFMTGILSFYLWKELRGGAALPPFLAGILIPLGMTIALLLVWGGIAMSIWTVVFLSLLVVGRDPGNTLARIVLAPLRAAPVRYIGRMSYSIYLSHMIFVYLGIRVLNGFALAPPAYLVLLLAWTLVLTLAASHVLFHLIEAPGIAWSRRWWRARDSFVPAPG